MNTAWNGLWSSYIQSGAGVCDWAGVFCSGVTTNATLGTRRITALYLPARGLAGTIPDALWLLNGLTLLDLSSNPALTGTISPGIGSLSNLQNLSFANCNLEGAIPSALGSLPYLQILQLQRNRLSSTIPSALGNPPYLATISLHSNQLTGTVPASLKYNTLLNAAYFNNSIVDCGPADNAAECAALFAASASWGDLWQRFGGSSYCTWTGVVCDAALQSFYGGRRRSRSRSLLDASAPIISQLALRGTPLKGSLPSALSALTALQFLDLS